MKRGQARFNACVLVSILMIGGTLLGTSTYASGPELDLSHATELRATLGFDASPAAVERAASDADAYPDTTWGIPLSLDEAAEIQRRIEVMHQTFPAILKASDEDTWAGWWIDQPAGGIPVLQFAGDLDAASALVSSVLPKGPTPRIVRVEHSLRTLQAEFRRIHDEIDDMRSNGIPVTGLRVDIMMNRVVMSLDPMDATTQIELRRQFGGTLTFDREPIAEADVDGCASGCLPLKAGLGMVTANSSDWPCTVGYLARRSDTSPDQLVYVTAGHCIEGGTPYGPWKHGSATIGSTLYFSGTPVEVFYSHSDGDVGLVKVDAGQIPLVKNKILTDSSPITSYDIEVQLISDLQGPNMLVCRMGRTTGGPQCGTISNSNTTKISELPGSGPDYMIDNVIVYGRDATGGDSGGPIYYTTGNPSTGWATLLGTHVHSDPGYVSSGGNGWYTPVDRGLGQLDANFPVINLVVCVTSGCGF